MRKILSLALLAVYLALPGCILPPISSTGGSPASALGPDGVQTSDIKSTLPQRIKASVAELWAWYSALKSRVDPAIEPMKRLYVAAQEMIVAVDAQDWLKALSLGAAAWGLVDEIKGMVKS